jgi:hypothetical protein
MRIKAERVLARDLRPGDLFSAAPQAYWDHAMDKGSCGEQVYIRTNVNADAFGDADSYISRITIER